MSEITVYHYDAFASTPGKGNPAGVVFGADHLSESEMQLIAHNVGFNETVFVLGSDTADLRLRYYTPGHEINLCGHATMASLFGLKTRGMLNGKTSVVIETNVGNLPIRFEQDGETLRMEMKQDQPRFLPFNGDMDRLAASMGLRASDIDPTAPIVYGSTGTWTLLIPIRSLEAFDRMRPDSQLFPDILLENPRSSLHPFCMEAHDSSAFMHARHFSSPYSGTVEDPVTGTASGVMGAYYLTYVQPGQSHAEFTVEQGQEIGRDGRVRVKAQKTAQGMEIYIQGTAVFVRELVIQY